LQQAFINILWNAIEAMPHGGLLTVTTDIDPQQETVEVHIIDTGSGIPEENLERIFEPFFTTKEERKGVGLGLSVAYGVIRQHHGEIQIQSRVGEGTAVTVQLPAGPRALSIEEQSDEYLFGIKGIPRWEDNAPRGKDRLEARNHKG
jgi:two-component system NtrC family sensor kinase